MRRKLFFYLFLFVVSFQSFATINATFINPGFKDDNHTGAFWKNVSNIMIATAEDLDIKLTINYANRNHILMKKLVTDALKIKDNYLFLVDEKSVITKLLLSSSEVHPSILFLFNSPSKIQIQKLKNHGYGILGSIKPDNFSTGYVLAENLYLRAKSQNNKVVKMLALLGEGATEAAKNREAGLEEFNNRQPNLKLAYRVNANWSSVEAYALTKGLFRRNENIQAIWSANDEMAKGAYLALQELEIQKKVYIGGVNWDKGIEDYVDVSIGGNLFPGSYGLVKIYEHKNGVLKAPFGDIKLPLYETFNKSFLPLYNAIHTNKLSNINFKEFTSLLNPNYEFTIKNLNEQLKKGK
jgi:hypothetical protein